MITEQRTPRQYGRKAFGPGRRRSEAAKALHVAESMLQHEIAQDGWTWDRYYTDVTSEQCTLAKALLAALRQQQAA